MNQLVVQTEAGAIRISPHIYGHFAEHLGTCIYEGLWVGENSSIPSTRGLRHDVLAALKELSIPNIRWPGGCFAEIYHWRNGINPREKRPGTLNCWGGIPENNHLQAMVLTDGPRILRTPTYHVVEMYKVHQGATFLPSNLTCGTQTFQGKVLPTISASASRDASEKIHLSLNNLHHAEAATISCELVQVAGEMGEILERRHDGRAAAEDLVEKLDELLAAGEKLVGLL